MGHAHHTREYVPAPIHHPGEKGVEPLPDADGLADGGTTAAHSPALTPDELAPPARGQARAHPATAGLRPRWDATARHRRTVARRRLQRKSDLPAGNTAVTPRSNH
ncbi:MULTISPECIES: hypothetical protein [Streptomyces]|uniref:hypothetical protein n=1 Tax=Streptomyces TaxID=1883 RepID=UPI0035A8F107